LADRDLLQSILINAPVTAVWAEITKLRGLQRPMMDTVLETTFEPGAPLYYKTPDGKRVFIVGRVVSVEPPTRLSHTWQLTTRRDGPTLVSWELTEVPEGTKVTIRHTGWPAETKNLGSVDTTWVMVLRELKLLLETGDISRGLKVRYALMRAFMWALPARTRAEKVTVPD
jgi:uncharacterized protein YndB with AHSA1/START domain